MSFRIHTSSRCIKHLITDDLLLIIKGMNWMTFTIHTSSRCINHLYTDDFTADNKRYELDVFHNSY